MKLKSEFSYNGIRSPRKIPDSLWSKIEPMIYLNMLGEYRCACEGQTDRPLGLLYYGNKSNPEWIVTLS